MLLNHVFYSQILSGTSFLRAGDDGSGAMSIAAHMLAFTGRDDKLFRGAIMQSGAPTTGLYQSSTSSASTSAYNTVLSKAGIHTPLIGIHAPSVPTFTRQTNIPSAHPKMLIFKAVPRRLTNYPVSAA